MECRAIPPRSALAAARAIFWLLAFAGFMALRASALAQAPSTPANIKCIASSSSNSIYWQAMSGATSYTVFRALTSGGTTSSIATGVTTASYTDSGLTSGQAYYYQVEAVNSSGSSSKSIRVGGTPGSTQTAAPEYVAVQAQSSSLTVTWADIPTIVVYNIYRSTSSGNIASTSVPIATQVSDSGDGYTDTTVTAGTDYYYTVSGVETDTGEGALYEPAVHGNTSATVPTSAPVLTVQGSTRSSSTITLSWTAVSGASSYNVFRGTNGSKVYLDSVDSTTTSYTDTPSAGVVYYYGVAGCGEYGDMGPSSNTASGIRLNPPALNAPTTGAGEINLSWNAITGALGYNIYRSTTSGQETNQAAIASVSGNGTTSYTDATASGGQTYYYETTATDTTDGNSESKVSNEESATPPDFSLAASPTSATVVQGNQVTSTITLTTIGTMSNTVSLSASGLPSGVTAGFSPANVSSSSRTSTLTLTASSTATTGAPVTVTVTGTDTTDSITRTTTIQLTVNPEGSFTVSPSPTSVDGPPAGTMVSTITVSATGGFGGTVTMSSSGTMPGGGTAQFIPSSVTVPVNGTATSTLVLSSSSTATDGTYPLTVTGTAADGQYSSSSLNYVLQGSATPPLGLTLTNLAIPAADTTWSSADNSVNLVFTMAAYTTDTQQMTVMLYTWPVNGSPPTGWYIGDVTGGNGTVASYTLLQTSPATLMISVPATLGTTLNYGVVEWVSTSNDLVYWFGQELVTPYADVSTADQTVDSRTDPRYDTNPLPFIDHNFGSTTFRGGLFVGNMPLPPTANDHSQVSRSYVKFPEIPTLPTSPAGQQILCGSLNAYFVGAMAASPTGGFLLGTSVFADTGWQPNTLTWDTQPTGYNESSPNGTSTLTYNPSSPVFSWANFAINIGSPNALQALIGSSFDAVLYDANEASDVAGNITSWTYFDKLEYNGGTNSPVLLYAYGIPWP